MDTSISNGYHVDDNVLLPPLKRLLAGLKRQSCSQSTSQCSHENNKSPSFSPSPLSEAVPLTEFDIRLDNLLRSYKNGCNMSPEEIAKAAGSAAVAAAKSAEAARAAAEEKAAVAAKAVSAAKRALDLVASMSEDMMENKSKKKVLFQVLYKSYHPVENRRKDEELAQKLHDIINSSPRISETSPDSNAKGHRRKKLKISLANEKNGTANGNDEGSTLETLLVKMDDEILKSSKSDEIEVNSCEVKSSHPEEKVSRPLGDVCINGSRKRERIKQKKLPLSICSIKDQAKPKELNVKTSPFSQARTDESATDHVPSLSMKFGNVKPVEVASTWKCRDFHVPEGIKPDKAVQS